MRQVAVVVFIAAAGGLWGGEAFATPFEPATIPGQALAVGHLDVDALRRTQVFQAAGGQAAIDAALDEAPQEMRPLARSLARSVRGVSFWRGDEHGAIHLATGDSKALGQLLRKLPIKPSGTLNGSPFFTLGDDDDDDDDKDSHGRGFAIVCGETLVLADSQDSLEHSVRVLNGKGKSLAGSNKLPSTNRQGVFMFVTLGDDLLSAIQKAAHSKMMQLSIRSLVVDVGEVSGQVTANARAEMKSADAVNKAKSILDGLRALGSLSGDAKASALLDGVTITANGLALEVTAKVPVSDLAKLIKSVK
jgi:hypothetical protein